MTMKTETIQKLMDGLNAPYKTPAYTPETVTINNDQKLFVIPCGGGYSCLGFDVLEKRALALGSELVDHGFDPEQPAVYGTLERYEQYQRMVDYAQRLHDGTGWRSKSELCKPLMGLEGKRVEVTSEDGSKRRFIVGKSTGPIPCHLEIQRRNSSGGCAVYKDFKSVRVVG